MFSPDQVERLQAFRRAAAQVREASIIASGASISFSGKVNESGSVEQTFVLFENERFRSLAMSLRLVYMQGEPATFNGIANILRKAGPPDLHQLLDQIRERYNAVIVGKNIQFGLHGAFEGQVVGHRDIFESWLYYGRFHQDPDRKAMCEELAKFGPAFVFGVNLIAVQLADCVLAMDKLVARALNEPTEPATGA